MKTMRFSPQQMALGGVLIAMSIVLSRLVSIPIGPTLRISIAAVPIFLAGLWMGPLLGAICGALADLIGCLIAGYAPNPLITLSSLLWGILPALLIPALAKSIFSTMKKQLRLLPAVFIAIFVTMLVTSLGTTTLGLSIYNGQPFVALWITRVPQTILLWVVDSLLVWILYTRLRLPEGMTSRKTDSTEES